MRGYGGGRRVRDALKSPSVFSMKGIASNSAAKHCGRVRMKWIWNSRWKWALIAGPVLLGALVIIGTWPLKDDIITREKYGEVRLGMSLVEVQKILGGPGKDPNEVATTRRLPRNTAEMDEEGRWENRLDDNEPGRKLVWNDRDSAVVVRLGEGGRVTDKMFMRAEPMSLFQRARAWIVF